MTFEKLWPMLAIPGEYDAMDAVDKARWRNVLRQAFDAARREEREACAKLVDPSGRAGGASTQSDQAYYERRKIAAAIRARGEGAATPKKPSTPPTSERAERLRGE